MSSYESRVQVAPGIRPDGIKKPALTVVHDRSSRFIHCSGQK